MIPLEAYAALTASVLMHVSWNLLARHVEPRCHLLWWGLLAHSLILAPWGVAAMLADVEWDRTLRLTLAITSLSMIGYFIALRQAYQHAPVALVYPLARSAPLLIALMAWLAFDEQLPVFGWLGIALGALGLIVMAHSTRHSSTRHALPWAMAATLCTSVYSLSDKHAVTHLPSLGSKLGFVSIAYLAALAGLSLVQRVQQGHWIPSCRPPTVYWLSAGLCLGGAYVLVIHALTFLPAAYVVAYANGGIVIAALLSITLFREREAWRSRLAASAIITAGLVLMSLGQAIPI